MDATLITGEIQQLAFGGDGILKHEGKVIFVPFAAPGERVTCRITKAKKNHAFAEIVQIDTPSSHRVEPRCPYFGTCGGCQLQHIDSETQLAYKHQAVHDALTRIGGFKDFPLASAVPSTHPWNYRRHVTLHLSPTLDGYVAGYIAMDNKTVLPVQQCPIFCLPADPIFIQLKAFLKTIECSSANSGKVTLVKQPDQKYLVVLHFKFIPPKLEKNLPKAHLQYPAFGGILVSTQQGIRTVGNTVLHVQIDDFEFQVSPLAFIQNHPEQSARIYAEIKAKVDTGPVLDLYCGIGITSLLIAKKGIEVIGVEYNKEAVRLAQENALQQRLLNTTFIQADVAAVADKLMNEKRPSWVIMNPPREGLDLAVVAALRKELPKKILYLSCMPSTLARDLKLLSEVGYCIATCQPFDMFPQTGHVETLVELSLPYA